jgi:hypothetical protein
MHHPCPFYAPSLSVAECPSSLPLCVLTERLGRPRHYPFTCKVHTRHRRPPERSFPLPLYAAECPSPQWFYHSHLLFLWRPPPFHVMPPPPRERTLVSECAPPAYVLILSSPRFPYQVPHPSGPPLSLTNTEAARFCPPSEGTFTPIRGAVLCRSSSRLNLHPNRGAWDTGFWPTGSSHTPTFWFCV